VPMVALGAERAQGLEIRKMVEMVANNVDGGLIADSGHFSFPRIARRGGSSHPGPAGDSGIFVVLIRGEQDLRGVERCRNDFRGSTSRGFAGEVIQLSGPCEARELPEVDRPNPRPFAFRPRPSSLENGRCEPGAHSVIPWTEANPRGGRG
jgi:hypothetical protein